MTEKKNPRFTIFFLSAIVVFIGILVESFPKMILDRALDMLEDITSTWDCGKVHIIVTISARIPERRVIQLICIYQQKQRF